MGDKVQNWVYVAVMLGLLETGEFVYNRFAFKLPGQILALLALIMAAVWVGVSGVRLLLRRKAGHPE